MESPDAQTPNKEHTSSPGFESRGLRAILEVKMQPPEVVADNSLLFTHERRQLIMRMLEEQQRVTVPELSARFSVSEVTIRKDLAWLEERKQLVRTHGGAISAAPAPKEQRFDVRERMQRSEKELIGAAAARFVQDGETIALDASTTALAMTSYLTEKRELTVVTNGLRIGMQLIDAPGISVLMPGGMLRRESYSLVGTWGKTILQQIHIKTAFVGARGLTLNEGLTEIDSEEVAFKRAVVEAAREVIAIVDNSKWDHVAFATFCPLERLKLIITDAEAPKHLVEQVRRKGVEVLIC